MLTLLTLSNNIANLWLSSLLPGFLLTIENPSTETSSDSTLITESNNFAPLDLRPTGAFKIILLFLKVGEIVDIENVIYVNDAKEIGNDIESIYNESKKSTKKQDIENLYLNIILLKLSRNKENNQHKVPLCEKIKEIVENNISVNIKEISDKLHYHPYYLNEVFVKNEGITLHKYITKQRLIRVREMLLTTDIPISEISHQCGFYSQSHMSNTFKNVYKITPGKMRKL